MNKKLVQRVKSDFEEAFKTKPALIASPGRINLIGEHIDYSGGFVFPAAIDKYIVCAIQKNTLNHSRIYALDVDEKFNINLQDLGKPASGVWTSYVLGVINEIQKKGKTLQNFDLAFAGNIPMGAGLSSSAALENAVVFGLNEVFNLGFSKLEMIQISMQAEHNFAGVQCGIMDQFSSMMGKQDHALFLNCDNLNFQTIPLDHDGYQLVLINSKVHHVLSDSPYNERRNQCKEGLSILQNKFPEIKELCHANLSQLNVVKDSLSEIVFRRCQFAIEENERVKSAKIAIESKNWKRLGELLYKAHHGAQHLYEISCAEVDFLVDQAKIHSSVIGSRMMGGGFGGCTINLIKKNTVEDFINQTIPKFSSKFGHDPEVYHINISEGTKLIAN